MVFISCPNDVLSTALVETDVGPRSEDGSLGVRVACLQKRDSGLL